MKFAILIVTYTSPRQTKRLIQSLNNGSFDFYIHLDKKVNIETHKDLFDIPNVYFVKNRIDIKWAGFTTVEAIISGVRYIHESGRHYDFISIISGQDYPIKSASYICDFLAKNKGKEFILYSDFKTEWTEALARVERYHLTDFPFKGSQRLENLLNRILPARKFPADLPLKGKETFWTLSEECAWYVVKYLDDNPRLRRFLKFTWGSDEFIFQTVIMASPFKDKVVNNNLRYVNWPLAGSRPNVYVAADFDRIMAADGLFGRKFDINTDEKILDLLDQANMK